MACGVCFFLMRRRPPRSARTDTLFPYTTLFRSQRNSKRRRLFSVRSFTLQPIILVPEHAIQKCRIAERLGMREPLQRKGDIIASEHDVDRVSLPIMTIEVHDDVPHLELVERLGHTLGPFELGRAHV